MEQLAADPAESRRLAGRMIPPGASILSDKARFGRDVVQSAFGMRNGLGGEPQTVSVSPVVLNRHQEQHHDGTR